MATVNITVRVDEETKASFDEFCSNVGMNATSAVNMFIKAVLRTRELPFKVTDINENDKKFIGTQAFESISSMRRVSERNGNSEMTLEQINAEINAVRKEKLNDA